jgi:hypothetical protein
MLRNVAVILAAILVITIGVFRLIVPYYFSAEPSVYGERGERDARSDIARGHYVVLGYGLPVNPVLGTNALSTEWEPEYGQCLRQRYGVEFRKVTGCVGTKSEFAYYGSYNAVSEAAIKQKFSHDVFEECIYVACKRLGGLHPTAKGN